MIPSCVEGKTQDKMKITIRKPLAFSEIGLKDNQEDALYPNPQTVNTDQRVFLMCDGMGGHEHGEVASNTVSQTLGHALDESMNPREAFESAIEKAYEALDDKDTDESGKKMGTTLTCLILDDKGAYVAHIGDSRVYQIRPSSGLVLQTSDHSLVNDLLKAGELTEDEAQNYPHKNIITRAMQPHQERRSKAEIDLQGDVQAGDYFFLCCDGVLEQLTNQRLCEILSNKDLDDAGKLEKIKFECDGKTKDNYTCWLIPIDQVEKDSKEPENSEDVILAESIESESETPKAESIHYATEQESDPNLSASFKHKKSKNLFYIVLIILLLLAAFIGGYYVKSPRNDEGNWIKSFIQIGDTIQQQVPSSIDTNSANNN